MGYAIALILLIAYIQRSNDLAAAKKTKENVKRYVVRLFCDSDFQKKQWEEICLSVQKGKKPIDLIEGRAKKSAEEIDKKPDPGGK